MEEQTKYSITMKNYVITLAVNTQLDLCIVTAWDQQTGKHYLLIDKAGIEYQHIGVSLKTSPFLKANYKIQTNLS